MNFEWDENKREDNVQKHGVDFVRAALMFSNPLLEHVPEKCGRFSDKDRLKSKGIEHFR